MIIELLFGRPAASDDRVLYVGEESPALPMVSAPDFGITGEVSHAGRSPRMALPVGFPSAWQPCGAIGPRVQL
jgi:hypothetical protein